MFKIKDNKTAGKFMQNQYTMEPIRAENIDGLKDCLNRLLDTIKRNPEQAAHDHRILFTIGNGQQSLIKVDAQTKPFRFYYCDLNGRAITQAVKEALIRFQEENFPKLNSQWPQEKRFLIGLFFNRQPQTNRLPTHINYADNVVDVTPSAANEVSYALGMSQISRRLLTPQDADQLFAVASRNLAAIRPGVGGSK